MVNKAALRDPMPDPKFPQAVPSSTMTLVPTHGLRWNGDVLEQRFTSTSGNTEYWIPVPKINQPKGIPRAYGEF
jgi:hypothetical protein